MRFIQFLKVNGLYILWTAIYFTLAWLVFGTNLQSLIIVSSIYAISIAVALSPIGEAMLRRLKGCRPLKTKKEKDYLQPLFDEVFQSAKETNPNLSDDIKLYLVDSMGVNSFAIGRKTIAVTEGATATLSEEELKGIIAHEIGHINCEHTKAPLLTAIGNLLFTTAIFASRKVLKVLEDILRGNSNTVKIVRQSQMGLHIGLKILRMLFVALIFCTKIFFDVLVFVLIDLQEISLMPLNQSHEYQADKFAHEIGFSQQLLNALYILQNMPQPEKETLSERVNKANINLAYRIEKLEELEEVACEE